MTESAVIADLFVILASAAVVAIVMQRIRLAVIPAYLITGAVIGPTPWDWFRRRRVSV